METKPNQAPRKRGARTKLMEPLPPSFVAPRKSPLAGHQLRLSGTMQARQLHIILLAVSRLFCNSAAKNKGYAPTRLVLTCPSYVYYVLVESPPGQNKGHVEHCIEQPTASAASEMRRNQRHHVKHYRGSRERKYYLSIYLPCPILCSFDFFSSPCFSFLCSFFRSEPPPSPP